ncbi:MAG: hypothetical protein ACPGUD_01265 [Parashewanella sp.]
MKKIKALSFITLLCFICISNVGAAETRAKKRVKLSPHKPVSLATSKLEKQQLERARAAVEQTQQREKKPLLEAKQAAKTTKIEQ